MGRIVGEQHPRVSTVRRLPHTALALLSLLALPALAASPRPPAPVFQTVGPPLPITLQPIASGLFRLTTITSTGTPGDGRLFVLEQSGTIRILQGTTVLGTPFLDIKSLVSTSGEQGLLGLAFHPSYAQNGRFFIYYTDHSGAVVIARYQVSSDPNRADATSGRILLTIPEPFENHNGGELTFGPDGYLYAGVGDGGSGGDPFCNAQQGQTLLGKILRIDVDDTGPGSEYAIPPTNPFRSSGGSNGMRPEVWAYGMRNPWRFSFDRMTGDLWIGDVGQDQREEVDLEPAGDPGGHNYGWKVMEGTNCFSRDACPSSVAACNSSAITLPILEFDHAQKRCSITGGFVYRGHAVPQLYGQYVFGDLCTGQLWAAQRQGASWVVHDLPPRPAFLTSFGEDNTGELYAVTLDGKVYRFAATNRVDTLGLYDAAGSRFLLKDLNATGPADRTVQLGVGFPKSGVPLAGDWDGDGQDTVGLFDPNASKFLLAGSGSPAPIAAQLVLHPLSGRPANAVPLAGDWNGDGKDTVGFYDRSTSKFELKNSLTGDSFDVSFRFGTARNQWEPIVGDWNGDGKDTIGLWDPVKGIFRLKNSLKGGNADILFRFGPKGRNRIAIVGDWNGDGKDEVGLYDPANGQYLLATSLTTGAPGISLEFEGVGAGLVPVSGEW
jgi:glucose/arabinose dehydrogenase